MPPKQSEDSSIKNILKEYGSHLVKAIITIAITYVINEQGQQNKKRQEDKEKQDKINSDMEKAVERSNNKMEYLERDINRNEQNDKDQEEDIEKLKDFHRRHDD